MTFDKMNWAKVDVGYSYTAPQMFSYISSTDAIATIAGSGYFNDITSDLRQYDYIFVKASDDVNIYHVTSATGATTVTVTSIVDTSIIPDGAITNAKVNAAAAIAWSKMAALTEGNLLLGSAANVATVTDFSADAQIGIGDGTTFNSVAVSGDIAIDNTGATTIQAGAVDEAMINPNTLTGTVAANVADANVIGGLPQLFRINTAGGATANTDVTVTHKIRVIDAWVVNNAAGTTSDTIQVLNSTSAITNAIDISGGDKTVARAGEIDDAAHEIAAAGTLRITETDGGGSDSPATTVYILAVRVA